MNITEIIARAASGSSKIANQRAAYMRIQLSNHSALTALADGTATRLDVDQLIAARNMAEALRSVARLGMQLEQTTVIQMERAIRLVKDRVRSGQVSRIK